ncbi:MAG TPA: dTDP-4-dehydrorhamnose 3,5-epimerase [Chromatiaceae bacterium]|nr:dTDP-4-dehydrorhamnose 3,5-epimerase [Chromatiaceae bacterium]HIN82859.1 dTDP-4-dehydrorhamnose 3,5-epimerase [Chromatiales bacterium]
MKVNETALPGVVMIDPDVYGDSRGFFSETWNIQRYRDAGIDATFVQDNISRSAAGVLRGLHFQNPSPQAKLVQVLVGEVFDVAVDIRVGSPTFGQWVGAVLSASNHRQFFIPEGFAHGFCVTSDDAIFAYKCSNVYVPDADGGVRWDDPAIGIDWPLSSPELSDKDRVAPLLSDVSADRLPQYTA